jgi:hypothetical protein
MGLSYSVLEPHCPRGMAAIRLLRFSKVYTPVRHGNLAMLCLEGQFNFLLARRRPRSTRTNDSLVPHLRSTLLRSTHDAPFEIA